ncbi:MAG: DNA starvation/stationary phase protection protein [Sphingomonadaceae bacterium]|nr:DNA starvation/stationary phase protection protein [Sphingomonadaceae bacterium]MCP5383147.1 DNA starvation/stationary phase protection protein [Altererythrobacter sp.]MCP5390429.1 DNA starvation/stationary phase protection protein [Sphingomonadaceae bacterium]MCP5393324.1 DNA starvation/stationary phase protection protein [Sphingomonadaceae bacterium]
MTSNSKAALVSELNGLLADHMALFFKTKNFHWHVAGPRFRDLHLLFDEHATEIQGQVDLIAERVRKLGENTLTSIGSITRATQVSDQDNADLPAEKMVEELRDDNVALIKRLKAMKPLASDAGDNATDGMIDGWTDMAEQRVWFLTQTLK